MIGSNVNTQNLLVQCHQHPILRNPVILLSCHNVLTVPCCSTVHGDFLFLNKLVMMPSKNNYPCVCATQPIETCVNFTIMSAYNCGMVLLRPQR